jgi:hypothetical protein
LSIVLQELENRLPQNSKEGFLADDEVYEAIKRLRVHVEHLDPDYKEPKPKAWIQEN